MIAERGVEPEPRSARTDLLLLGMLLALTALFFAGVVRGETFFRYDFHQTFHPLRVGLGSALRAGLPLWDSSLNNGMPLLANPMHAVFYPPNLLFAWFPAAKLLSILTVAHVLFGACGAFLLCRRWGLAASSSATAAVAFGFNGTAISAVPFANLCWAQAWLPWLLLAWSHVVGPGEKHKLPATGALAVAAACLLSLAEPSILVAAALGIALLTADRFLPGGDGGVERDPRVILVLPFLALALAVLLVSPFLAAYFGYAPESERGAGFVEEGVVYWSMHPLLGFDFFLPAVFGDARFVDARGFWARTLVPEKGFHLFAGLYVGGVLLGLAATGARRRTWPLTAWLILLILLALGRWGPVYPWLASFSFVDTLRYPVKFVLPAMLPLALLAGIGADRLARGGPREARPLLIALLLLLALAGAASVVSSPGLDGWLLSLSDFGESATSATLEEAGRFIRSTVARSALRAAIPLMIVVALVLLARRWWKLVVAVCLPAIVLLDLASANARLVPTLPASFYEKTPRAVEAIRADPGGYGRIYIEYPEISDMQLVPYPERPEDLARWERSAIQGYIGATYGLDLAFNTDVGHFRPMLYAKLASMVRTSPVRPKLVLLGFAGVTHLVTFSEFSNEHLVLMEVIPCGADRPQRVSRNLLALPRARLVPTVLPYEDDEGFMAAVDAGPDDLFRRATLIDRADLHSAGIPEEALAPVAAEGLPEVVGEATIVEERGAMLSVRTSGSAGYLVLSDTWTTGWRAQVDGRDAPLLRADYAFRAVPVPAGTHDVVFRYSPLGFGS